MLTYLLGRTAPVKIIVCSFGANDYFTGSDGDPPDTDRWTVDLAGSGICEIDTNQLEMFSDPYTSTATLTHNAVFTGYNSIQIDYDLGSSSTKQSVNFYIEVENQSNSYWVRFYKGYTLPTPRVYVDKDDGSTSTIFSDTSNGVGMQ
jgi:hypothetical protein